MLKKTIVSLVTGTVILAILTQGIVSAALALFAFSLLIYYALQKETPD